MSYSTFNKYFLLFIILLSSLGEATAQTCNGTPTAGSITTSTAQACPGNVVMLSLSGESADNGITLQWQSSPDGSNWTNIGSATSDAYAYTVPNGLTYVYFRVAVSCTQSSQTAFTAAQQISLPLIASYSMLPFTEDFEGDWIQICANGQLPQPVQFGAVWQNLPAVGSSSWRREDNGDGASWSQPDYGAYATGGAGGSSHSARFHSTYATSAGMLDLYVNCGTALAGKKLSFDYNNADGADSLEVLLSTDGGATFSKLYTAYTAADWTHQSALFLTTSATAIIRFKGDADNGNTDIGIDNIKVEEVTTCSGTPSIGAAVSSDSVICNGAIFKLSLSSTPGNVEGITYQWQSSADGTSNWNNIAGATDSVFNTSEGAATFYRAIVSCSFSGLQATSTSVKVIMPTPMKGTYTINSAVATGGTNFKSFSDAAAALNCSGVNGPVIVDVKTGNGVYNEQVFIDSISGASSTNTITFEGHGNTIKFSSQDHDEPGVINFKGTDYVTLDSLIIDATPPVAEAATRYGFGVYLTDFTNNNTIHRCTIITDSLSLDDRIGYVGILTNNSSNNNTFDSNKISGGYAGILVQRDAVNTRITNNNLQQFYYAGCYIYNNGFFQDSLLIEGNFISRPFRNSDAASGIFVTGVSDAKISKNRIFNINAVSENVGITFTWGNQVQDSKSYVTNNLIYNLSGVYLSGLNSKVTDNIEIAHNTIALNYTATQNGSAIDGIFVSSDGAVNTLVENNLVAVNGKGIGKNHAITLASLQSGIVLNNNDYFIGSDPSNAIGLLGLNSSATLADWQAVTGAEANSVSMDPVFDDPAQGNFKPTAADLDNRGLGLAITTDILNVTRSVSNPDIGAYEFVACHLLHGLYTIDAKAAPGTARTYLSFNEAYDALKCGIDSAVIFNVKPGSGVYNEQLNMKTIDGSSAVNTVTFKGNGETIKYSSADEGHKAVIQMYGTNHVIFDSLIIDATPPDDQFRNRFGFGVQLYNGANDNTFHACTIMSDTSKDHADNMSDFEYDYMAVAVLGNSWQDSVSANHDVFSNNKIMGGYIGIQVYGKAIADSFMHNDVTKFMSYGLLLRDGLIDDLDITDSLVVEGNEVHNATGGSGIIIQYGNNVIISKNIVHDLRTWGCTGIITQRVNTVTPNSPQSKTMVTNNLVYNLGADTPINYQKQVWGIVDYGGGKVFIEHNTVSLTNVYFSTDKAQIWGILSVENSFTPGDLYIRNNLVTMSGTGIAKTAGIAVSTQSFLKSVYHIDYNNYFYDTTSINNSAAYLIDSAKYYKLADWQTKTKMDSNSVTIDPVFTNVAAANYKPTSYPMDNHGDSVGIATDIIEVTRNLAHPDLGAYEYAACPGKFAGFSFDKSSNCSGDPISFIATDTTFDWQTVVTWSWDFGNGTTSSLKDPSVTFDKGGTYTIKLTATSNEGCTDDVTDVITINDCYKELFIPNTFTPNGDGNNDVLKVYGNDIKAITFMVFNQWGQKMYESNNVAVGWDGTQNGKPQPTGVYMYVCRIIMSNNREVIRKGSVNLIR